MPSSPLSWALALLLAASPPADGQGKGGELSPRARELLEVGTRAYERGDFAAAIAAFEEGYAVEPAPVFLYTWAQAARYMDDCAKAIELYERFLATDPPEAQRAAAEEYRAKCAPEPTESPAALPAPPPQATAIEPRAVEPAAPVRDVDAPARERSASRRRVDPLGTSLVVVGIAVAGAGLGLTGAGIVAVRAEADATVYEGFRDHHRRKIAFLGSGIPLASIGVALLVGGIARLVAHRRSKQRTMSRAVAGWR
jgi:hypothetical protein